MHYANGKEARAGDLVYLKTAYGTLTTETIGLLRYASSGSSTCNGQMQVVARRYTSDCGRGEWFMEAPMYLECVTVGQLFPFILPGDGNLITE